MEMKKFLSSRDLKIIAYVTMLIDHIGAVLLIHLMANFGLYNLSISYESLFNIYTILRTIGRISFPLFAFGIVEGFIHTSNMKKYLIRLFLFAIISEIPFDLAIRSTAISWEYQNVIWTFLIGIIALYLGRKSGSNLFTVLFVFMGMILGEILNTDYGAYGVLLMFAYYFLRDYPFKYLIWGIIIYYSTPYGLISLIFMFLYNGKKGMKSGRWLYGFYPGHLLILYLITLLFKEILI